MLEVESIETFYGQSQALFDVSLRVGEAEVVTLLGRNGMGKSTTIRSILGLTPIRRGTIAFGGRRIDTLPSYSIARLGVGLVPEGRHIFPNLTVRENLLATAANYSKRAKPYTLDYVLGIFPRLQERLNNFGSQISGGEQQMLAIGRAMMINPKLLILDEATEGLAPLIRGEIWRGLTTLKGRGQAILVVDKNLKALLDIADRHYILEKGQVAWSGPTETLQAQPETQSRYLGV
jgi:branched-chain amino acid transport system ATP-binding protein